MLVSKKDLPLQYGKVGKKPPFYTDLIKTNITQEDIITYY